MTGSLVCALYRKALEGVLRVGGIIRPDGTDGYFTILQGDGFKIRNREVDNMEILVESVNET
jgi:hypothetical protein